MAAVCVGFIERITLMSAPTKPIVPCIGLPSFAAMTLVIAIALAMVACGSKDAVAGKWTADLGADGVVTWEFNGSGKCSMKNTYMEQDGTYTIEGDQMTVKLELWDEAKVYTFSVDGDSLTMNDNAGMGISGTFTKE